MSFNVTVDLLRGTYDAADTDPNAAEWPPHPARLFCALVASAATDRDREALLWLEKQEPPTVLAAEDTFVEVRESWVVTNAVDKKDGNLNYPMRVNQIRRRVGTVPTSLTVIFAWDTIPDPATLENLDSLASKVPYFGRSTGTAILSTETAEITANDYPDLARFRPSDYHNAEYLLRCPYPGYLDELDAMFETSEPPWQVSRSQPYRLARSISKDTEPGEHELPHAYSLYPELISLQFAGVRPDGRLAPRFTQALRNAVLSVAGDDAPAVLHGHGVDGIPHVAFLALPDVGHPHADGRLMGLAVAIPDMQRDDTGRRNIIRAVMALTETSSGPERRELNVPGLGGIALVSGTAIRIPWGSDPRRWRTGSTVWSSATPVILDRYPKKGRTFADEIRRSCRTVGLPEPLDVTASPSPLVAGAVKLAPRDLPAKLARRLYGHVTLTFDHMVHGPVFLGAGRNLGLGLLSPVTVRPPKDRSSNSKLATNDKHGGQEPRPWT